MRFAAAVVSTCVMVAGMTTPTAAQVAVARYTPPPIQWGTCADPNLRKAGATCGDLVVPLDYARPGGEKIKIAVSRVKHKSPTPRRTRARCWSTRAGRAARGARSPCSARFVPNARGRRLRLDRLRPPRRRRQQARAVLRPRLRRLQPAGATSRRTRPADARRGRRGPRHYARGLREGRRRAAAAPHAPRTPPRTWTPSARRWAPSRSTSTASPTAPTSARSTPPSSRPAARRSS